MTLTTMRCARGRGQPWLYYHPQGLAQCWHTAGLDKYLLVLSRPTEETLCHFVDVRIKYSGSHKAREQQLVQHPIPCSFHHHTAVDAKLWVSQYAGYWEEWHQQHGSLRCLSLLSPLASYIWHYPQTEGLLWGMWGPASYTKGPGRVSPTRALGNRQTDPSMGGGTASSL